MSRPIDADALRERLQNLAYDDWNQGITTSFAYACNEIIDIVEEQPTIEQEIIRCKDCKHWIPYDWMFSEIWQSKNIADYPEDDIGCDCCDMAMKANDFCSRAERRENEP